MARTTSEGKSHTDTRNRSILTDGVEKVGSLVGAVRHLPNGNTFIDEGMTGRFFQMTPAGEIVWEYVSPYVGKAPLGPGGRKLLANWVYRGQPVPYDWVPAGTPHSERAVVPPDVSTFHLPASR
jgi:hypothetical protein